ncbi:hypothetical protein ACI2OX_21535 [Bacillus sp. N9]
MVEQNTFFETILNNMEDVVISCDADGKINYINDVASHLEHLIGASIEQWNQHYTFYAKDEKTILELTELPLYLALKGQVLKQHEIWIEVKENGMKENIVINGRPIINSDGKSLVLL